MVPDLPYSNTIHNRVWTNKSYLEQGTVGLRPLRRTDREQRASNTPGSGLVGPSHCEVQPKLWDWLSKCSVMTFGKWPTMPTSNSPARPMWGHPSPRAEWGICGNVRHHKYVECPWTHGPWPTIILANYYNTWKNICVLAINTKPAIKYKVKDS